MERILAYDKEHKNMQNLRQEQYESVDNIYADEKSMHRMFQLMKQHLT